MGEGQGKPLVIVGAGGFGREVAWLVEDINKVRPTWNLLGFVDDKAQCGFQLIRRCYFGR